MSTYPKNFFAYNEENKGKLGIQSSNLGTLKDEFSSYTDKEGDHLNLIVQFDCLRSKCYTLKTLENEMKSKCKG